MISGAIFDLDGTILDSMSVWDTIADDYLRSIGITPEENISGKLETLSMEKAAQYLRDNCGVKLSVEEIIRGVNSLMENFYVNYVQLKRGVGEFLKSLSSAGVKMCVATATDFRLAKSALERCGVIGLFSGIITDAQVGCGKDNPRIYREALKLLGTEKSRTLVFEDALHAVKTAKTDGFRVAAVYDPAEENQDVLKEISDIYIQDYPSADVGKILKFTI